MQIGRTVPGGRARLRDLSEAWRERIRARWQQGVSARDAGLGVAGVTAAAVVSGVVRPLPFHSQLLIPILTGGVGWLLGRRWADRPVVVLWGILGLFAGMSAAQRLDSALLLVPLAIVGTIIGVLVASQTRETHPDRADTSEIAASPPDGLTAR